MKNKLLLLTFSALTLLGSHIAQARVYHYISIDSGGMLGLIPTHVLADIEAQTNTPIYKLVDGMMGTSTGSIISALLSIPAPDKAVPYTAKEVTEFYLTRGADVFGAASSSVIANGIAKLFKQQPDYSNAAGVLATHTQSVFGQRHLSQALGNLYILSRNVDLNVEYTFDSQEASRNPNADVLVSDAVRASSSVADVFGKHQLTFKSGGSTAFIDSGSVGINDPTPYLYNIVAPKLQDGDSAFIYSLSTGFSQPSQATQTLLNGGGDTRVSVIRIQPDISSLTGLKPGIIKLNLVAAATDKASTNKQKQIADTLISGQAYKQMLANLKAKAELKAKDEL